MEDQLSKTQEDLHITKISLEKCRAEADSLRAENSVLSRFVDQLTEEIESCQSEILNCRDALKDASQRSAQSQAEFHELHGRTDVLRGELEGRLEKEVTLVNKLTRELDEMRWEEEAKASIFLEVVDDVAHSSSKMSKHLRTELSKAEEVEHKLEMEVAKVKMLTRELEDLKWEHNVESLISVQVVDDIACQLKQEIRHLKSKLGKDEYLESKLEKEVAEVKRMTMQLEGTRWECDAETSIYLEILDDMALTCSHKIRHLRGELRKEGALHGKLQKNYAEVKKLLKEFEQSTLVHEAESSIYLEVVNEMVREWALKLDNLTVDVIRKEEALVEGLLEEKNVEIKKLTEELERTMWEHDLEIKKLTEELEQTLWEHDIEIQKLTEELELTMWEHEAELSIYLEVVGERAREWAHIIDISAADFTCKQVVRRKELQASCSFSGRTQKESLAYEDSSPLLQGGLEGVKAALIRPSPLKGPSPLGDQSAVSSPGKTTDPIVVVVRRNTQAAVEGFMVDIGESPSKKASKEVVSSLRMEVLELRREKEHLLEQHTGELHELKCESMKEVERIKIEVEEKCQKELAILEDELSSVQQKLQKALLDKESSELSNGCGDNMLPAIEDNDGEILVTESTLEETEDDSGNVKSAASLSTLVAERDELSDQVRQLELQIGNLQEKVTKLEGERSWLEERVPGLEKKLATEQSRLEDTVAGHAFERDQLRLIISSHKSEQTRLENEVAVLRTERNDLATAIATLGLEWRSLKLSNQNESERWRSAYVMALKDMERALGRTQKQVKEERAQKGAAESDAQRMKTEILTLQQESKDLCRHLERIIAENIGRAVGASQQVEYALCRKIHQQNLRFEALQSQVDHLLQVFRLSQMSEVDYLHTVENLCRAEQEVDILGDEVDSLVALLERLYTVLDQYAPVLLHYPGVAEMAKLVRQELMQRSMQPSTSEGV